MIVSGLDCLLSKDNVCARSRGSVVAINGNDSIRVPVIVKQSSQCVVVASRNIDLLDNIRGSRITGGGASNSCTGTCESRIKGSCQ